jgi:probable F420-dependent oxidoreductase
MRFGLYIFPTDQTMPPNDVARAAEDRGFEALIFPEHTHMPLDHTPFPSGGEVPVHYKRTLDPFVAITAAAAATQRLQVGTGVCLIPQHDPITLAKQVASADLLSGGRVLFGIGAGWNVPETANHGTDPDHRFGVMRERIEAMKAIWTEDEASYHGRHVDFDALWSWPKPVQKPHPPILVGGSGPHVFKRVLAYGDEWMPNRDKDLKARIGELGRRTPAAGRDPIPVSYFGAQPTRAAIDALEEVGVYKVFIGLPSAGRDEVERALDEAAQVMSAQ